MKFNRISPSWVWEGQRRSQREAWRSSRGGQSPHQHKSNWCTQKKPQLIPEQIISRIYFRHYFLPRWSPQSWPGVGKTGCREGFLWQRTRIWRCGRRRRRAGWRWRWWRGGYWPRWWWRPPWSGSPSPHSCNHLGSWFQSRAWSHRWSAGANFGCRSTLTSSSPGRPLRGSQPSPFSSSSFSGILTSPQSLQLAEKELRQDWPVGSATHTDTSCINAWRNLKVFFVATTSLSESLKSGCSLVTACR